MPRFVLFARLVFVGLTLVACQDAVSPTERRLRNAPSLNAEPLESHPIGPPNERPIQDFLNAQGTFCYPDGLGGCLLFDPPVPNFLWFKHAETRLCAAIDYAGVAAAFIERVSGGAISVGTTFDGTVTELPLADGKAKVTVTLWTNRALAYLADDCVGQLGVLLFGHTPAEVLAGRPAALGESFLRVVLVNSAPGAPLPDLIQAAFLPVVRSRLRSLEVTASASGPLRAAFGVAEGTPGSAGVTLISMPATGGTTAFPVDRVTLRVVGR